MRLRAPSLLLFCLLGCARGVGGGSYLDATSGAASAPDAGTPDGQAGKPDGGAVDAEVAEAGKPAADGSAALSCTAENTCNSATVLASVQGDSGKDVRTVEGAKSQWLSVKVTDAAFVGTRLAVDITLTSHGGANYDLFVHKPQNGGHAIAPKDCSASPSDSEAKGDTHTARLSWPDESNQLSHSDGDSLVIAIEVRHASGPCGTWTLTVAGNP